MLNLPIKCLRCGLHLLDSNLLVRLLDKVLRDRLLIVQGKAAIDVVCNPLGKSGGSAIQQVMIIAFGSLSASTPYLGAILLAVVLVWMGAARSLNVQVCHPCCVNAVSGGLAPCLSPSHANPIPGPWRQPQQLRQVP